MLNEKYRLTHYNPTVAIADGCLNVDFEDSESLRYEVYSDAGHVCITVSTIDGKYETYRTIETYDSIRNAIKNGKYCYIETELVYQSMCNGQTQLDSYGVNL